MFIVRYVMECGDQEVHPVKNSTPIICRDFLYGDFWVNQPDLWLDG